MRSLVLISVAVFVFSLAADVQAQEIAESLSQQPAQQNSPQIAPLPSPQPLATPDSNKSKVIYVNDFELDAVDASGKLQKSVPAIPPSVAKQMDPKREQSPVEQAGRLVDFMSATLVKELERAGYSAHRLRPGETRPTDGIRISGIFGEPDQQNRLHRAVMGPITGDAKMALFVGITNLARPEQALYASADPTGADNRAGVVITVSSYAPVAKFEIEKDTTEKAVKDTAATIVADLSALLSANVIALTQ
jgi:hypothetical protein